MAVDFFLKLEGVKGESQDDRYKDQVEIESFSWGLTQSGTVGGGGGGGAGKAQFQDIHFTSKISKASPQLFLGCATGEHIKTAVLSGRKAGGTQLEFLQIKLNDVMITSYQSGGAAGDVVPTDSFSLNFAKIEFSYTEQDRSGKPGDTTTAGWDLRSNVKL